MRPTPGPSPSTAGRTSIPSDSSGRIALVLLLLLLLVLLVLVLVLVLLLPPSLPAEARAWWCRGEEGTTMKAVLGLGVVVKKRKWSRSRRPWWNKLQCSIMATH
jgi:hypothetical protein